MLTTEQVKKGATTPKKALELSIKHWWENYNLTRKELAGEEAIPCAEDLCGLCRYYRRHGVCRDCPVEDGCIIGSLYDVASDALSNFQDVETDENCKVWRKAAKAMHKYLCSLR